MISRIPAGYAQDVPCPVCDAKAGQPCDWTPFRLRSTLPHPARVDELEQLLEQPAEQVDQVGPDDAAP